MKTYYPRLLFVTTEFSRTALKYKDGVKPSIEHRRYFIVLRPDCFTAVCMEAWLPTLPNEFSPKLMDSPY